ncbi:response regulator [Aquitalea magnusonii]|uniref:response regulator n=1 Tax=Aquitalea magnusonii TaxID=332411 RepID=UPI001EFB5743|nr:response regulator [Aquitalea magnusonii]
MFGPDIRLIECTTLAEASAAIHDDSLELALLDLNMPGMQGLNGVASLRRSAPVVPLVVVSPTSAAKWCRPRWHWASAVSFPNLPRASKWPKRYAASAPTAKSISPPPSPATIPIARRPSRSRRNNKPCKPGLAA